MLGQMLPLDGIVFVFELPLAGPVVHRKPLPELLQGQLEPGPTLAGGVELAGGASQSVQSIHDAPTLPVPALTSVAKGMIDTLTSPGVWVAFCSVVSRVWAAFLSSVILLFELIEPVLSSASARLSFLMPQSTSPVAVMST